MRHFLKLTNLSPDELASLLCLADDLRAAHRASRLEPMLAGQTLAMLFTKPSLRTRVSFEQAMTQLGGRAMYLAPAEVGLGERETPADVARVLSRYVDAIMARVFAHADVEGLAAHASVPVMNGLSDLVHPCQALADLMTLRDHMPGMREGRLVYLGDGNNVAHSLLFAGAMSGLSVAIVHPEGYGPDAALLAEAEALAVATGAEVCATTDLAAVEGAAALYADVWASMGQEDQATERQAVFQPYRLDSAALQRAAPDCIVLHCLPAHRGEEIAAEVIDGPQSRVFDQAENRMHAQRALLAWLLGDVEL